MFNVLMVDDNDADLFLMKKAFKEMPQANITGKSTPEDALAFIREKLESVEAIDLVIADINLGGSSGDSLLLQIRSDSVLKTLPVIAFSGSNASADVVKMYSSGANAYVVKPVGYEAQLAFVNSLCCFWGDTVELPKPGG